MNVNDSPARTESTWRRVEYRLPTDVEGLDYRRVTAALNRAVRDRDGATTPVRVRVDGDAVVVFYDEELPTEPGHVDVALHQRSRALRDALGLRPGDLVPNWDELLRVVRAHARTVEAVTLAAQQRRGDGYRDVVPALLPHDWAVQLDRQVPRAGNVLALAGMVKRLVDDWRLETEDLVDDVAVASGEVYRD